jgi:hypothetical protein
MKDVVNENLHSGATDTARDLSGKSGYDFNIEADQSDGGTFDQSFPWRRVSDVLNEMNEWSYTDGTEIFYELRIASVNPSSKKITYTFVTRTGQLGIDRTDLSRFGQRSIISYHYGNLVREFYEHDARKEVNYVYVLGPGEGENRSLEERTDSTRTNASIFNRIEGFVDASNVDPDNETAEMQAAGDEYLARKRPRIRAGGKVISIPNTFTYGRHWGHGDKMRVDVFGRQFDGIIRVTELRIRDGEEEVTGTILHIGT